MKAFVKISISYQAKRNDLLLLLTKSGAKKTRLNLITQSAALLCILCPSFSWWLFTRWVNNETKFGLDPVMAYM